jgi:hypothetical protein
MSRTYGHPRPQLPPFASPHSEGQTAPFSEANQPFPEGQQPPPDRPPPTPRFVTQRTPTGTWRIGAATTPFTQVAITVTLNAIDQEMVVIRNIFLFSIPGVLLLVAGGVWGIAASSLHPIRRLTKVNVNCGWFVCPGRSRLTGNIKRSTKLHSYLRDGAVLMHV